MASTSSSTVLFGKTYDVFLSFRGEDAFPGFTSHLYAALGRKNIKTVIDDRLGRGEEISSSLLHTISGSKISVMVFSEGYANSSRCLEELVYIMECRENMGKIVLPIFYHVDPSDVENQTGNFGAGFGIVKEKFNDNSCLVEKWCAALTEAARLSGWNSSDYRYESDLIEEVAAHIKKLCPITYTPSSGLVGIDSHFEQIISLLKIDRATDVHAVGIWGMGGLGKTTLAQWIFGHIANQFDQCCFLSDVREKSEKWGLDGLIKEFYSKLGFEVRDIQTVYLLPSSIWDTLRKKKVLVVLDDVNDPKQLEALFTNVPYGPGSRIIVTSRDKQVLTNGVDEIYKMEGLNYNNALQLLSMKAFKMTHPPKEYEKLSDEAVDYAGGLPLALEVLGSDLRERTPKEWSDFLNELKQHHDYTIQKKLRISYDKLHQKEKDVFLNIACFFKGDDIYRVKEILDGCDLPSRWAINRLIDKSLISIVDNAVTMHDLIAEMGHDIAEQEGSRLFKPKDILHMLRTNAGYEKVQGISFDTSNYREVCLHPAALSKMHNLRILIVYQSRFWQRKTVFTIEGGQSHNLEYLPNKLSVLDWENNYPFKSLASGSMRNLVVLNVPQSNITQLWNGGKGPINLKRLDLGGCRNLRKIPNICYATNLEEIILCECESLIEIHPSINGLSKLVKLDLEGCKNLEILPEIPGGIQKLNLSYSGVKVWSQSSPLHNLSELNMTNCEKIESLPSLNYKCLPISHDAAAADADEYFELNLRGCRKLHKLLEIRGNLKRIDISRTAIEELPSSIGFLSALVKLTMEECECLEILPQSICELKSLEDLNLSGCSKLKKLPPLNGLISLRCLHLKKTALEEIPNGIGICELKCLEKLDLSGCSKLGKLPILSGLSTLQYLNLEDTALEEIPNDIGICELKSLEELSLSGCTRLRKLSFLYGLSTLSSLRRLNLSNCMRLEALPKLPHKLVYLNVQNCTSLTAVESSSFIRHSFNYVFNYCNCCNLGDNGRSNILSQQAEFLFKNFQGFVDSTCGIPGSQIPDWYDDQSQGSLLSIEFPHNCFNTLFIGFAFSVVVECNTQFCNTISLKCKCSFKNVNDCNTISKCFNGRMVINDSLQSDHVFLWFDHRDKFWRNWLIKNNSNLIKTTFEFEACIKGGDGGNDSGGDGYALKIKKCGVQVYKRIIDTSTCWDIDTNNNSKVNNEEEPQNKKRRISRLPQREKNTDSVPSSSSYVTAIEPAQYMDINERSRVLNKEEEPQPNATVGFLSMFAGKENSADQAASSSSYFQEQGKEVDTNDNRSGENEEENDETMMNHQVDILCQLLCQLSLSS